MSNAIRFLETLGSKPALTATDYAALVSTVDADDGQRQALLERDHVALNGLLHGREKMICMVWQPEEEPMRKDDDQPEPETPAEDVPPDQD